MFVFLILSLPELAKVKIRQKLQISFRQIPKQKQHHLKVQTKRFHLSGHSRISSTESKVRSIVPERIQSFTLGVIDGGRWAPVLAFIGVCSIVYKCAFLLV